MRTTIRARLMAAFFTLAIGPLLLVGFILAWQSFTVQKSQAVELQREVALRAATQTAAFLTDLETQMETAVRVLGSPGQDIPRSRSAISSLLARQDVLTEFVLLDRQGRELVRESRIQVVAPNGDNQWQEANTFRTPMSTGDTYYSPVRFDERTGEPLMTLSVPITNFRTGTADGVLVGEVRLKQIWDLIAWVRVGSAGHAYIVDQLGRVVAHPNPSVVLRGTQFSLPKEDGFYPGLAGDNVVLASQRVPITNGPDLYVVVERPVAEALALTIRGTVTIAGILLSALAVATFLMLLSLRQIVRPVRDLAATAERISQGDLSSRARVDTQDELGILARAFNSMTGQLGRTIENLQSMVAERDVAARNLEDQIAERIRVEEMLRDSNRREQEAVSEERKGLARELHDSITQSVFSITLTTQTARILLERDPSQVPLYLDRLQESAQGALTDVRSLIHRLHTPLEEQEGLVSALERHVAIVQRRDGLTVDLTVGGKEDIEWLPREMVEGLLGVAQEALNNVVKHAETQRAELTLMVIDGRVRLQIEDHGAGFDLAGRQPGGSGLGLTSMGERARMMGAVLQISSSPGHGTRIALELVCPAKGERHGAN